MVCQCGALIGYATHKVDLRHCRGEDLHSLRTSVDNRMSLHRHPTNIDKEFCRPSSSDGIMIGSCLDLKTLQVTNWIGTILSYTHGCGWSPLLFPYYIESVTPFSESQKVSLCISV